MAQIIACDLDGPGKMVGLHDMLDAMSDEAFWKWWNHFMAKNPKTDQYTDGPAL